MGKCTSIKKNEAVWGPVERFPRYAESEIASLRRIMGYITPSSMCKCTHTYMYVQKGSEVIHKCYSCKKPRLRNCVWKGPFVLNYILL